VTLSRRLTLWFAAVAVTVSALIGALSYVATARSLDAEALASIDQTARSLAAGEVPDALAAPATDRDAGGGADGDDSPAASPAPAASLAPAASPAPAARGSGHGGGPPVGPALLGQVLDASGVPIGVGGRAAVLPVTDDDRRVAASAVPHDKTVRDVTVDGVRYLMLTEALGHGNGAVQVARSRTDHKEVLERLAGSVVVIALVVAAAAAVAGWFLARALTRRLVRLTAAAERVSRTGRLDVAVPVAGSDEVGRLGVAFDRMLDRLARSRDDQQRLVQNAGHELRTPLTSIRTNVSLLRRADELSTDDRAAVLDDLTGETRELTDLVDELVELATDRRAAEPETDVDLDAVARRVAERVERRRGRPVQVAAPADGVVVRGRAQGLERALTNLVDNAVKFDPGGTGRVDVVLRPEDAGGLRVEVLDRGPGVPPEDLGRIFERFHRATGVRSLPGSGLGLSIVHDVIAEHEGDVFAAHRDGGGAVIGFTLPAVRLQPGSYPA